MTHCYIKSIHGLNKILSYHEVQKSKKPEEQYFCYIIRLFLQITEHLQRNVQTRIVSFLQNIVMQQY